ncbi:MAG: type II toxin-antitoxin system HicA family toxin [Opitutales bacterium]|nr:type II toxin-antitoxin system HicA family toxin [Opitutales bacterium]NRA27576.1 type II toxin-antitoxin system HicA family toxin [Opitutales bacterium]
MPKLLSSEKVVTILLANGFEFVSQRGSHMKYRDASGHTVIVPAGRREIPRGTIGSIIRQSGLPRRLF